VRDAADRDDGDRDSLFDSRQCTNTLRLPCILGCRGKDGTESDVIGACGLGVLRLFQAVGGYSDEFLRAEQLPCIFDGKIFLTEMDAVRSRCNGDVRMVIDNKEGFVLVRQVNKAQRGIVDIFS
jgi:hypothetical protein